MAFFKSTEEKLIEEQEGIKEHEGRILKRREYHGKVGHIHQGLSSFGLWGVRNNGKMKFKSSKFEIHDTKILIERNKMIIQYSSIKEIFHENDNEAIILLNNDSGVPIKSSGNNKWDIWKFKAFINILNDLIDENKTNNVDGNNDAKNQENSEDKFDKLIKLGEMHDKGLLSDEEFVSLKNELLSGNTDDSSVVSENEVGNSKNSCENCGADVSTDDEFCSECGTKLTTDV